MSSFIDLREPLHHRDFVAKIVKARFSDKVKAPNRIKTPVPVTSQPEDFTEESITSPAVIILGNDDHLSAFSSITFSSSLPLIPSFTSISSSEIFLVSGISFQTNSSCKIIINAKNVKIGAPPKMLSM